MEFVPGQHIVLGIPGDNQTREYSVYSSIDKEYLEVIIREVEEGIVSRKLHRVKEGDKVYVDGPFGFFTLDERLLSERKYLFVATGTGIAPFHSIIGSYSEFNYKLLHGVRFGDEAYEKNSYDPGRYTLCTTKDSKGDFKGRVTDYLRANAVDSDTLVYLCGNCEMIYEVYDLLTSGGLDSDQIRTEVYF
jgi:ferredoxin--NADP+ reductase/benzoate/toluate 1,2-dioxygenase reductase subunit